MTPQAGRRTSGVVSQIHQVYLLRHTFDLEHTFSVHSIGIVAIDILYTDVNSDYLSNFSQELQMRQSSHKEHNSFFFFLHSLI